MEGLVTDPGLRGQHLTEGLGASATPLAGADRLLSRAPEPVDPAGPGPTLPNLTSGCAPVCAGRALPSRPCETLPPGLWPRPPELVPGLPRVFGSGGSARHRRQRHPPKAAGPVALRFCGREGRGVAT